MKFVAAAAIVWIAIAAIWIPRQDSEPLVGEWTNGRFWQARFSADGTFQQEFIYRWGKMVSSSKTMGTWEAMPGPVYFLEGRHLDHGLPRHHYTQEDIAADDALRWHQSNGELKPVDGQLYRLKVNATGREQYLLSDKHGVLPSGSAPIYLERVTLWSRFERWLNGVFSDSSLKL